MKANSSIYNFIEKRINSYFCFRIMKHREIAVLLELPLPTVLSKYHRALKKMFRFMHQVKIS